jgi:hypothetical protein
MKRAIHYRVALCLAGLSLLSAPLAQAQVQTIDPNSAIDSDLAPQPGTTPAAPRATPVQPAPASPPVSGAPYASPGAPTRRRRPNPCRQHPRLPGRSRPAPMANPGTRTI